MTELVSLPWPTTFSWLLPRIHVAGHTDMIIDTHTHLYLSEFENGGADAVRRAIDAGVEHLIMPNVDLTTIDAMRQLHEQFPENISMAMGLHPTEIGHDWREQLEQVKWEFDRGGYVAVGEVGIDLYWDATFADEQMQALEAQMRWAVDAGLPVIIHCREGLDQVLEVLQAFPAARGVMHSFGGTDKDVDRVRRVVDFYFGINGIVTFKNSRLRDTLPAIGVERLLLETDSPYLAPVPHRGKRNESAYIVHTAAYVADSLGMTKEAVADATTSNARALFNV